MKTGIELITEERQRQIQVEKWTPENDDQHVHGELSMAAACYAFGSLFSYQDGWISFRGNEVEQRMISAWPWALKWWKPTPADRVRELSKAGALIAAEIDRLQRLQN